MEAPNVLSGWDCVHGKKPGIAVEETRPKKAIFGQSPVVGRTPFSWFSGFGVFYLRAFGVPKSRGTPGRPRCTPSPPLSNPPEKIHVWFPVFPAKAALWSLAFSCNANCPCPETVARTQTGVRGQAQSQAQWGAREKRWATARPWPIDIMLRPVWSGSGPPP